MSNEHDNSNCSNWHELDDTLADGPSPADVPEEAREWLAEQRVMHGLLRAVHTADASAREARVASVMESIDRRAAVGFRRHWLTVALAASVMATIGIWFALPSSLPTAEAAMARAVDQLARNLDRHYHVRLSTAGRRRSERVYNEFDLIARPGMRFLIEGRFKFGKLRLAGGRVGCDGETIWLEDKNGRNRRSGRLVDREELLEGLGDILDIGYLDLHSLVEKLPAGFIMRVVDRSTDSEGRQQLHIKAWRRRTAGAIKVRKAELIVDELTGMVKSIDAEVFVVGSGLRHVVVEYRGQPEPDSVDYSRPW